MSRFADGPKTRTSPELRALLERWLAAESEPLTRLQALHVAAQVCRLADEVLTQRVIEARAFYRSWTQIGEAVGITKQSANRRWRALDTAAQALAAERERQFKARRVDTPAGPTSRPDLPGLRPQAASWWDPPDGGALSPCVQPAAPPADDGWGEGCGYEEDA